MARSALVSSAAARLGGSNEYVDYAASKGAVDTLGVGLGEVAGEGIRVNVVRPGVIDTEIHARGRQPDRIERMLPVLPLGRAGHAAEIADAVLWLLGDELLLLQREHPRRDGRSLTAALG